MKKDKATKDTQAVSTPKAVKPNTVIFGGLEVSVLNQKDKMVPQAAVDIKLPAEDERALALAINHDLPALLIGETGTGKTSAVRKLAYMRRQGYVRINMHGYNTPDELIGCKSVKNGSTYYENGILTNAMLNGHIVVLDEINATPPDCTFIIHGLLDEDKRISLPNGDVITPHKDFRFFATMNPDYEGTKSLNRAFLDRFAIILNIEVLKPELEKQLLIDRNKIAADLADKMVSTAWLARKAYQEAKTMTLISTRSLLQWSKLVKEGLDEKTAYVTSVCHKARTEEQAAFLDFYCAVFKINPTDDEKLDVPFVTTQRVINNYEKQVQTAREEVVRLNGANDNLTRAAMEAKALVDPLQKENEKLKKGIRKLDEMEKMVAEFQKVMESMKGTNVVDPPTTTGGASA